jgi:NTP pyrophosphatase (non-canonical NTP hydrolase)
VTRDTIWLDILAERFRQKRLLAAGKFDRDVADPTLTPPEKLGVVAEEFGEVARVIAEDIARPAVRGGPGLDKEHLREELVQLATCCVAWIEEIDELPQELTFEQVRAAAVAAHPYQVDPITDGLPIEAFAVQPGAS